MALLETKGIAKNFGGLQALNQVDLTVEEGEITGLIGPNGSGKTTMFNIVSGFLRQSSGTISIRGQRIDSLATYERARLGLGRTFQLTSLFKKMTVLDNVKVGYHTKMTSGLWNLFFKPGFASREEAECTARAEELLAFLGLEARRDEITENLPTGEQRLLEIARALASGPTLLMLDEPASGLNPTETAILVQRINKLHELGTTVLIIEHDMKVVMNICQQISVLNYGAKIAEGTPAQIAENPKVIEAYLGEEEC